MQITPVLLKYRGDLFIGFAGFCIEDAKQDEKHFSGF